MKVLQLIARVDPPTGGPPPAAIGTSVALTRTGIVSCLFVVSFSPSEEFYGYEGVAFLQREGVDVHAVPIAWRTGTHLRNWGASTRVLIKLTSLSRSGVDVIQAHGAWTFSAIAGLAVARASGAVAVLMPHGSLTEFDIGHSPLPVRAAKRLLRRLWLRWFDLVVVASDYERAESIRRNCRAAVSVIPHVILEHRPARISRGSEPLRIGFLGRVHPVKNLELLIEALEALPDTVRLVLAGDGDPAYVQSLRGLAERRSVSDRIDWLGFTHKGRHAAFFDAIDCLVMPSENESFGLAAAEALAVGLPVIVSQKSGIADLVQLHGCGFVIDSTVDSVGDALRSFTTADQAQLSAAASRAAEAFLHDTHAKNLLAAYESVLDERSVDTKERGRSSDGAVIPAASVAVVVTTLDEELHIQRCVASARRLGPAFVVDGLSADRTVDLAHAEGAEVVSRAWSDYAEQKNWALDSLPLKTEWVLLLDADEWVTDELRLEIATATRDERHDGYWIPRRNVFLGRPLRRAGLFPDYQLRLLRVGKGRFENRAVHEHIVLDGSAGFLRSPLMHENLKGVDAFIERHRRYAQLEAVEMQRAHQGKATWEQRGKLTGSWPQRRRALKTRVWYRSPFRPALRFLWMYVIKGGLVDGREGRIYIQLISAYEAMIDGYLLELEQLAASGHNLTTAEGHEDGPRAAAPAQQP